MKALSNKNLFVRHIFFLTNYLKLNIAKIQQTAIFKRINYWFIMYFFVNEFQRYQHNTNK
jgi:hypothetical protein